MPTIYFIILFCFSFEQSLKALVSRDDCRQFRFLMGSADAVDAFDGLMG